MDHRSVPTPYYRPVAMPPTSILKKGKNVRFADSYECEEEIPASTMRARSQYNVGSHLGPMKGPSFNLHWQLLPYDRRQSKKRIRFDVAFPVECIVFQECGYTTKLSQADLCKPAGNFPMTKMDIIFKMSPFSWEVDVKNARGITCRDVFEEIYKTLNKQLTREEYKLVRDRLAVEDAFKRRCTLAPGLTEVERSFGWKRVDVLLNHTVFLGLTQPDSGSGDWILNLGPRSHVLS